MPTQSGRLIAALVVFVALLTAAWTYAQSVAVQPVTPTVLSGADLGFRVEGNRGGTPVGTLVVKVSGHWVEVDFSTPGQPKRISAK